METNPHDLENLLRQLGLGADNIDEFVGAHRLPAGVTLAEAPFWSSGQAAFLTQAIADDADWSGAVDELATRLS